MINHVKAVVADVHYLIAMLSTIFPVSVELAKEFKKHAVKITLDLGEHILEQGGICKYMYFIKSGAVMGYTHHNQKKIITYITVENEFVSSLSGLYGEKPSREGIKAIEPTVLIGVHTDILLTWYERFFDLNFIIRKVYENYYRDAQERSHIIRVGDAKERFLYFSKTREAAVDRIPIDILASFLDMKPRTLLQIKKDLQRKVVNGESEVLLAELIAVMVDKQWFLDKNLTVQKFAIANQITERKLNNCISEHLNLNFKDFVNRYRISYFKKLYHQEHNLKSFTIESLALAAGFASRSSFYLAYKKVEGAFPKKDIL